jgi:hypothetical protein
MGECNNPDGMGGWRSVGVWFPNPYIGFGDLHWVWRPNPYIGFGDQTPTLGLETYIGFGDQTPTLNRCPKGWAGIN